MRKELIAAPESLLAEGARAAGGREPEITREIIFQYFSGAYLGMLQAHRRWRKASFNARIAITAVAALVVLLVLYSCSRTYDGSLIGFASSVRSRLYLFVPAIVAGMVALMPYIWRLGWELPAGLAALVMGAQLYFFGIVDKRPAIALIVIAVGAIGYGIYLRLARRGDPLELEVLEPRLDAWTDRFLRTCVENSDAPISGRITGEALLLASYPKLDESGLAEFFWRRGADHKIRLSPKGFAIFDFRPETLVIFEGAIDLIRQELLYSRVHQFSYEDVAELIWTADADIEDSKQGATPGGDDRSQSIDTEPAKTRFKLRIGRRIRHRVLIEIRLASGRGIAILLRDSRLVPDVERFGGARFPPEDKAKIARLWNEIVARRQAAREGRAALPV